MSDEHISREDDFIRSWPKRPRVMIESPYGSSDKKLQQQYIEYAKNCVMDSLLRGEAPLAGHLFYTQVLDDDMKAERDVGICCDMEWLIVADAVAVYDDYEISDGMIRAINSAQELNIPIYYRKLGF